MVEPEGNMLVAGHGKKVVPIVCRRAASDDFGGAHPGDMVRLDLAGQQPLLLEAGR